MRKGFLIVIGIAVITALFVGVRYLQQRHQSTADVEVMPRDAPGQGSAAATSRDDVDSSTVESPASGVGPNATLPLPQAPASGESADVIYPVSASGPPVPSASGGHLAPSPDAGGAGGPPVGPQSPGGRADSPEGLLADDDGLFLDVPGPGETGPGDGDVPGALGGLEVGDGPEAAAGGNLGVPPESSDPGIGGPAPEDSN